MKRYILFAFAAACGISMQAQTGFCVTSDKEVITHIQNKSLGFSEDGNEIVIPDVRLNTDEITSITRDSGTEMTMEVTDVTNYGCHVTLLNGYDTPAYFVGMMPLSDLTECESAADYYDYTYRQWEEVAEAYYMTVDEYLEYFYILQTQDLTDSYVGGLDNETEYCLYAFGCSESGERLTPVNRLLFRTAPMTVYDVQFDVELSVKGKNASMTVIPSDETVPYYRGILTKNEIERYGNPTVDGNILAYVKDMVGSMGLDPADFYDMVCRKGTSSYFADGLSVNSTCYAFVFATDPTLNLCTPMKVVEFETGEIVNSDNQITTEIVGPSMTQAFVTFTPTNEDTYIGLILKAEETAGKSDAELVKYVEDLYENPFSLWYYYAQNSQQTLYAAAYDVKPGEELVAVAFGYEIEDWSSFTKGKATTDIMKTTFTMATESLAESEQDYNFYMENFDGDGAAVNVLTLQAGLPVYYEIVSGDMSDSEIKERISTKAISAGMTLNDYLLSNSKRTVDFPYGELMYLLLPDGPSVESILEQGIPEEYFEELGINLIEANKEYRIMTVSLNEDGSYAQPLHYSPAITVASKMTKSAEPKKIMNIQELPVDRR